jgi:hypothetical protein
MENEGLGTLIEKSELKAQCCQRVNHAAGTLFEIDIVVEQEQAFGILDSVLLPGTPAKCTLLSFKSLVDPWADLLNDSTSFYSEYVLLKNRFDLEPLLVIAGDWRVPHFDEHLSLFQVLRSLLGSQLELPVLEADLLSLEFRSFHLVLLVFVAFYN